MINSLKIKEYNFQAFLHIYSNSTKRHLLKLSNNLLNLTFGVHKDELLKIKDCSLVMHLIIYSLVTRMNYKKFRKYSLYKSINSFFKLDKIDLE